MGAATLGAPLTASASPLDPGITTYPASLNATDCSTPHPAPGQPGWSAVGCAVGAHRYVVPPGVHQLRVDVLGAAGGSGGGGAPGGAGEEIKASLVVTPGQLLEMAVGGAGGVAGGGFNGGGDDSRSGASGRTASGGGGGSTDIRVGDTGVWTRILTAAGGGGGGGAAAVGGRAGGNGGRDSRAGQAAPGALGGTGGQPSTAAGSGAGGGTGAVAGTAGSAVTLVGGNGGTGAAAGDPSGGGGAGGGAAGGDGGGGDGGGGGGGYGFGGGGAGGVGATAGGGGGGGGSSFVNPAWLVPGSGVDHLPGVATGNGSIVITYHAPPIVCGQTIYASMTLTGNLDCRGRGDGVVLAGEGGQEWMQPIVLDLGGFTLRGDAGGTGVVVSQEEGTVQDGTIRGFAVGVGVRFYARPYDDSGIGIAVARVTITGGGSGVVSLGGAVSMGTEVDHSTITDMSGFAVRAFSETGRVTVTDSTIQNTANGIVSDQLGTVARNDLFTGNGSALSANTDGFDAEDNTLVGNGYGIDTSSNYAGVEGVVPEQAAVTITGNVVRGTANGGIEVSGGALPGSVVSGNLLAHNGIDPRPPAPGVNPGDPADPGDAGDGILAALDPSSAANLTVAGNTARGNSGWGVDAVGVTDGGGNVSSLNGSGQCRGVACTAS
jgi:hypothetical protein